VAEAGRDVAALASLRAGGRHGGLARGRTRRANISGRSRGLPRACPRSFAGPALRRGGTPRGCHVKVRASVKPICEKCRVIKRHGKLLVICQNVRHKQVQG